MRNYFIFSIFKINIISSYKIIINDAIYLIYILIDYLVVWRITY